MKLKGKFVLRQVMGDWIAIPVGEDALHFGGMIVLNPVSRVIWQNLELDTDLDAIVAAVLDRFDVSEAQARVDAEDFLQQMRQENLIEE